MANNNYFANQNPTDIAIQSEDGGGMVFTKQGKYLFGSKLPDINQQLNEEFYQGNVDVDPNTNSSYIAIMNAQSEPVNVDIPSTNQYSLFTPPENVIVESNPPQDDCGNLFNDASSVLLNWENDNKNLGWDPYGANGSGIKDGELAKAQKYFLDNYWSTNNKNTGDFSITADASTNIKDPKLIINNLPGGLRIMAAQFSYNAKQWWTRILAAVGPDWLNSPGIGIPYKQTANLSPNSADSYNIRDKNGDQTGKFIYNGYKKGKIPNQPADAEFTLTGPERIQLFINQYDQIISAYQTAPVTFLESLKDETLRYYRSFVKGNNKGNDLLKFYEEYVNKAFILAKKYASCPAPQIQSTTVLPDPNKSTNSTPLPSPTPAVSLTAQEVEEGIYEANFLPASESEGFQLFEFIDTTENNNEPLTDNDIIQINEEENNIRKKEGKPPLPKERESKKTGTVKSLVQNNDKDGDLGDLIYYPTPIYNQSDSEWGSYSSKAGKDILKMSSHGCAYNTLAMLLGSATKDATATTPYSLWNSGVKNTKSILVHWSDIASVVGKTTTLSRENQTMADIEKILKSKPVGFEWRGGNKYPNGWGWDAGYNNYHGKKKGKPKVATKGDSYTCCNQHWMVITGKNKDGTYTVFDPAGGIIRKNQTAEQIQAGLNRIIYVN